MHQVDKAKQATGPLVVRSAVPARSDYQAYRQDLRYDFYYSCAYCTAMECEAIGVSWEIDHYEPKSLRPDLSAEYGNLMYSCEACNNRKSGLSPPQSARIQGHRFFRPDTDIYSEHFASNGRRLKGVTTVGEFSIENLDLNRHYLQRLRGLRERLYSAADIVSGGISALRGVKVDRLPAPIRKKVLGGIDKIATDDKRIVRNFDSILREYSHSELLDEDPEARARSAQRRARLIELKAMFPGVWQAERRRQTPA